MSFSLVLHLLFQAMFCRPFYEHCNYYSKKGAWRQEKNDSKLRCMRHFPICEGLKKFLFHTKCGYLDFLRFFIPYVVEKPVKLPFHKNASNFSAQFFIAPVDNFCYTVKRTYFHRFHFLVYYVIHKLLINLCITFQSCVKDC